MPYLTPDPADFDEVCRVVVIPAGYSAIVMGALVELTNAWNWEDAGSETVDDAVSKMQDMIDGAYESDCATMGQSPNEQFIFWNEGKVKTGNALALQILATQQHNGYWRQNTPAVNDEMQFDVLLNAGTFDLTVYYVKGAAEGIMHWFIDGVEDDQTIDGYSASQVLNAETTISITILDAGLHTLVCKMATKNASSSNYFNQVTAIKLLRTGD